MKKFFNSSIFFALVITTFLVVMSVMCYAFGEKVAGIIINAVSIIFILSLIKQMRADITYILSNEKEF